MVDQFNTLDEDDSLQAPKLQYRDRPLLSCVPKLVEANDNTSCPYDRQSGKGQLVLVNAPTDQVKYYEELFRSAD